MTPEEKSRSACFVQAPSRATAGPYTGMVGKASVSRLLEIALAEMRADPAILCGDPEFYDALAQEKRASAHAWTEFYAGHGPRPVTRHLP